MAQKFKHIFGLSRERKRNLKSTVVHDFVTAKEENDREAHSYIDRQTYQQQEQREIDIFSIVSLTYLNRRKVLYTYQVGTVAAQLARFSVQQPSVPWRSAS